MSPCELANSVSRLAERAQHLTSRAELDNAIVTSIDHPDMLIGRDEKAIGITDAGPLGQICSLRVEYLNPLVLAVANVNTAFAVDHDAMRQVELARSAAVAPPRFPS